MFSESRGHVLRVAAVLHVLFCYNDASDNYEVRQEITEFAVKAAAYIAARGSLLEEVERFKFKSGMFK